MFKAVPFSTPMSGSLRNSVFDDCEWAAEASSLRNLVPGFQWAGTGSKITNAICAAARGTPAPGDSVTLEVEGTPVRGRFLDSGKTIAAAQD
jgi:hypothetical protein